MLAADFGASGGRVMAGDYDGKRLVLSCLHRFANDPVWLFDTMHWDFLRLLHELKAGISKAWPDGADSIGVDTWGVDFGLLDGEGRLLENPVHYRDGRTAGMLECAFRRIPRERFYEITGSQFMEINTAFQLLALREKRPALLERAQKLLLMPDLFNYYLSGTAGSEYTAASTTQLLDARRRGWSAPVIDALGLPERIFLPVMEPGTVLGPMCGSVCRELGRPSLNVVAVAGHDTQCALAAVPSGQEDFIFVSCGTWSLFGTELAEPVIDGNSLRCNLTNEGAYGGRISFLKNTIGLWLVQESRRQWLREGREYSFSELEAMAAAVEDNTSYVDPDDPEFVAAGDIPSKIRAYCGRGGQAVPGTPAQIVRCVYESLALKYRVALEEIRACTHKDYPCIHLMGGGTNSGLLCRLVADVCGLPVHAGPVEATAYGNLAIQLAAAGEVRGPGEMRELIRNSEEIRIYEPKEHGRWEETYQRFKERITEME